MNTWIVVLNYNGWDDTIKCLESLDAVKGQAEILLVDNASREDRLGEMESRFPWIRTVANPVNGGWAGGNNAGIEYALNHEAEQVILLNNDTTVSPKLVSALLAAAERHPDFGILGPVLYFMDDPETVMTDGVVFNRDPYPGFFERREVPLGGPPRVDEVDIVNGCCMMVRRAVIDAIGPIDEKFFLIHEESDFCLRARAAGFRCGVLNEGLVWHKGSVSFKRSGGRVQRYYDARNLRLLLSKHVYKHKEGRARLASMKTYWKYVYHRYCIERDNESKVTADAVLEGVHDSLAGRFGPEEKRKRPGVAVLRGVFEVMRKVKGSKARVEA